ncbi:MAG: hypothetical protein OXH15_11265 [Gammaproteobacteria bacterium]|nr:hypothetical protein [Gammaproteobacteria bacterium]
MTPTNYFVLLDDDAAFHRFAPPAHFLLLDCDDTHLAAGASNLFHNGRPITLRQALGDQRLRLRDRSRLEALTPFTTDLTSLFDGGGDASRLTPRLVFAWQAQRRLLNCYRFCCSSGAGTVALSVTDGYQKMRAADPVDAVRSLLPVALANAERHKARFAHAHRYTKWRPDIELERKYTFPHVPDIWRLANMINREIVDGALPNFVPEVGMDFQVWDYESYIHEIADPKSERGYISFIPQCDGLMTVKRKWFEEAAEERIERLSGNLDLRLDEADDFVARNVAGVTGRLPCFRRKRFDVNFESLDTGNIFGIYLDICRIPHQPHIVFSQCEVEYCRTRSLLETDAIYPEYEQTNAFTVDFLRRHDVPYEQNLFSKLDFVRHAEQQIEDDARAQ